MLRFASAIVAVLAIHALVPLSASAVEIKNVRPSYGPFGATRSDMKFLPGDILYVTYDLDGLKLDPKTKSAKYVIVLDVFSAATKEKIFSKETPSEVTPQLGGDRVPGDLQLILGRNKAPGQYIVRIAVQDRIANETKEQRITYELLPPGFGIVGVEAGAIGLPGLAYTVNLAITDFTLDANKNPKGSISLKITDDTGKEVGPPMSNKFPEDLTEQFNVKKDNLLPMHFPIFPNRPGRFTVEVTAVDALGNRTSSLRYPLQVLDLSTMTK